MDFLKQNHRAKNKITRAVREKAGDVRKNPPQQLTLMACGGRAVAPRTRSPAHCGTSTDSIKTEGVPIDRFQLLGLVNSRECAVWDIQL